MHRRTMRRVGLVLAISMIMGAFAVPASATKPDPGSDLVEGHKIWICHATRSLSNPYVKILIDIAAWDITDPDSNDHGPEHHLREKDGFVWGDYELLNPDDECGLDVPPPPPPVVECPNGDVVDFVVEFDGNKLVPRPIEATTQTVAIDIPAGTYDVTLISGDYMRGGNRDGALYQPNERWRLLGSTPSGYSDDLIDTIADISGQVTTGLSVVFADDVTSVTAEHWSVFNEDRAPNSVVPEYACLTSSS